MGLFKTKYGYFTDDGKEFVITTPRTPKPWINIICNGDFGTTISQTGSGYTWKTHASLNRITRWEQDLIKDEWGKYIYIRDNESKKFWSLGYKPVCKEPEFYECHHGIGYTKIISKNNGVESSIKIFVPESDSVEIWEVEIKNSSKKEKTLSLFTYFEWLLGAAPDWHREFHRSFLETEYDNENSAIIANKRMWEVSSDDGHWNTDWPFVAYHSCSVKAKSYDCDKESFIGMYNNLTNPRAVVEGKSGKKSGKWNDSIASLQVDLKLKPGQSKKIFYTLGAADNNETAFEIIKKYKSENSVNEEFSLMSKKWDSLFSQLEVSTPDKSMDFMLNTWLKYQVISGRLWARTAYYQMGGGIGFRDQLQDSLIFLPLEPEKTKEQILLHSRHQFKNGTVYHWWHPMTEVGLPTNMTDDLLWLPYLTNKYIEETNDYTILEIKEPFIDDKETATIYDHCLRSIKMVLSRFSERGLPLIGAGDWNDGLSAVGLKWKGESVWLGHFLFDVLNDFIEITGFENDDVTKNEFIQRAGALKKAINEFAWDGEYFYYGTKDSGELFGSHTNKEGKIHLNAQTWAVISNIVDRERANKVMDAVEKNLEYKAGTLLLHPAYTESDKKIGYLTRYGPGMRENGGVYTHAATWSVIAEAKLKRAEAAYRMFSKINPIVRGKKPDEYVSEPYVTPGNIEGPESPFYGKGGWSWYSGSGSWLFRSGLNWILGVRSKKEFLIVDPCIPAEWKGYKVKRVFRGTTYRIEVKNPAKKSFGVKSVLVDSVARPELIESGYAKLPHLDNLIVHEILITLG